MDRAQTAPCFVVCAPGLETVVVDELAALGLGEHARISTGGITLDVSLADLYRLNLHLRAATRVLVRLGEPFLAKGFDELVKKARRLEWERYLQPAAPVALRVTCHKSRLYHSGAVAERVQAAINARLGGEIALRAVTAEIDEASVEGVQQVLVRIVHDQVQVSVDSSGEALHRRSYRLATAKAPLRESLAAAVLLAAGWDGSAPLLDPFCGAGTIPIEAAWIARGIAPGSRRRFAFMDWSTFEPALWERLLAEARENERPSSQPVLASDRDAGAISAAASNADRAGVQTDIQFSTMAFSAIAPPAGPGWVVTNPPYGLRVSARKDLRDLYARLGAVLREKCPGWQVAILSADDALLRQTRLVFDRSLVTVNGGVRVRISFGRV